MNREEIAELLDEVEADWAAARDDTTPNPVTMHTWMITLLRALLADEVCVNPFHVHVDEEAPLTGCYVGTREPNAEERA